MAGFTQKGLAKLRNVMSGYVDRRVAPGLVALISHEEQVHVEVIGCNTFDQPTPMTRDTIFRIASVTKPISAAAAMLLIEDCKIRLDDPIDPWLPELANRRVLESLSDFADTVPASRPITVRDLFTYTMGFGSIMAPSCTYPIQRLVRDYNIGGDGPPRPTDAPPRDEWLRRLGSLPWLAQPGQKFMYHVSGDVLGALIERVSGQSLGSFMRERLFGPLGMKDTGFHVPPSKLRRLPTMYCTGPKSGEIEVFDGIEDSAWGSEPAWESAGGGLVSTLYDCYAFLQMMLNKGRHGNDQVLSRASVELMTSDQLTPEQRSGSEIFFGKHSSWGLGVAVDIKSTEIYQTPGRFGWTGGFGTTAYADPVRGVIGILFTQRMMDSPIPPQIMTDFWTLTYSALAN